MIKTRDDVSKLTITRMAIYYNALKRMLEDGETMCLSSQIGQHTGISSSIIRKDLSSFGEFGTKGVGYRIDFLLRWIGEILGYNTVWNTIVVGMEMPLLSISCYQNFLPPGFRIAAVLDMDERNYGAMIPELGLSLESIRNLEAVVFKKQVSIGLVAVQPEQAQFVTDRLVAAGVAGIANFTQTQVTVPESIALTQINAGPMISQLSYDLARSVPVLQSIV
ncbi:redox-sensing transcriptional repressor Rex [Sporomusa termitida]|uniref:Redox-sensing transcriptional repressor Rex n=1 Tax=Sporomusa termitida TaxID=2377 RepID=A0A517DPA1_9FIRM|nr:redox-sensing transcriptional repressor Rex [Sporomusa termitida]QDR79096.1 Redox-sensing transcriptional repressor Rex [Sporomusa termitida]